MDTIRIRWLISSEVRALKPVFDEYGVTLPNPTTSKVMAAFNANDEIVGFAVAQLMLQLQPLWVKPEERNQGIAWQLSKAITDELEGSGATAHCFTSNEKVEDILKGLRFVSVGTAYERRF